MTPLEAARGAFAVAAIVFGGFTLLRWVPEQPWASTWPVRLALAHLVGAAAMAWIVSVTALFSDTLRIVPVYCMLAMLVFFTWKRQGFFTSASVSRPRERENDWERAWKYIAIVTALLAVVLTGWALTGPPDLTVDANWNWALKAKIFFLAGSFRPIFDGCCTKPNYPVLFPLQSWWIYRHIGHVGPWWHQANGFLFYLDLLVLTFAACRASMSAAWAWTATAIVIGDPLHMVFASRGQPDVAVSVYLLASSLLLAQYFRDRSTKARALTLLLLLGAAQTKNEGLCWAAIATVLLIGHELRWGEQLRAVATGLLLLCAAGPWAFIERRHVLAYGPEEPIATLHTMHVEFLHRIKTILVAHFASQSPYSLTFLLVLCLPLLWFGWRAVSKPILVLIGAQLFAYFVIYFVVADQPYQLRFMGRALGDIAPALLVTCLIGYHTMGRPRPPKPQAYSADRQPTRATIAAR